MTINTYRAAVVILLIAVVALTVALMTRHTAPAAASTTTVSNYNDGFATSKQDDCEQGFAAACAWLKSN